MKPIVVRHEGALDRDAARTLLGAVRAVPGNAAVVVDLSAAYPVDDAAVALLTAGLTRARAFRVRGLTGHHERVLRLLGLSPGEEPGGAVSPPGAVMEPT